MEHHTEVDVEAPSLVTNEEKCLTPSDEGSPPSYDSVVDSPSGAPPSYASLFGEIKQAREDSANTPDFLKRFAGLVGNTIAYTVCLGVMFVLPIASIIIGATYKDSCRVQKYIPIYLIVMGAFGILQNIFRLYHNIKKRQNAGGEEGEQNATPLNRFEHLVTCFLLAWFIAGNVWIYSVYKPDFINVESARYCDVTLYLFAFWVTTASYILIGLMCCCVCCVAVCAGMANAR